MADGHQSLRIVGDPLGCVAQVVRGLGDLRRRRSEPGLEVGEGRTTAHGTDDRLQLVGDPLVADQGLGSRGGSLPVGDGVGEQVLLLVEAVVLVGVQQPRIVELVELVAQQVDLSGAAALVAAELVQLGLHLGHPCPGLTQRLQVDTGEAIEGLALRGRLEQLLVRVLAVQLDEGTAALGQLAHRDGPAVDVGAAARARCGRDHPREHDLLAGVGHEPAVDDGLLGAGAHHGGVGPGTEQQLDGADDERLAGAGLPGERGESVAEHESGIGEDAEISHGQLGDHGCALTGRTARTWT